MVKRCNQIVISIFKNFIINGYKCNNQKQNVPLDWKIAVRRFFMFTRKEFYKIQGVFVLKIMLKLELVISVTCLGS